MDWLDPKQVTADRENWKKRFSGSTLVTAWANTRAYRQLVKAIANSDDHFLLCATFNREDCDCAKAVAHIIVAALDGGGDE